MKTTQYVRQEKAIASADSGGIRQRWLWGLRVLRDPEAMSSEKSLRHGVAEQLIAAATKAGRKLSGREIRYRLQAARTYRTEGEIGRLTADFEHWTDVIQADFPVYDADPDEPPADHRTAAEKNHDHDAEIIKDLIRDGRACLDADGVLTTTPTTTRSHS